MKHRKGHLVTYNRSEQVSDVNKRINKKGNTTRKKKEEETKKYEKHRNGKVRKKEDNSLERRA
jgi:hypothetical protein